MICWRRQKGFRRGKVIRQWKIYKSVDTSVRFRESEIRARIAEMGRHRPSCP